MPFVIGYAMFSPMSDPSLFAATGPILGIALMPIFLEAVVHGEI